jgi:hypothetical protein
MGRKRQSNRHLPANMQHRHGRYYFVRCGKWTPLAKDYGPALMEYAALVGTPQSVYSVKDAIWQYIEHAGHRKADPLSEKTLEGYRYSATNLCAVFGKLALSDLTRPMVYRYLVDTGTVQANRDKALLSAAYTHAGNMGHFTGVDPTKRTQFRNEEKPRQRYVTDAELTKLIDHAPPKLACIARFIELTGMRHGRRAAGPSKRTWTPRASTYTHRQDRQAPRGACGRRNWRRSSRTPGSNGAGSAGNICLRVGRRKPVTMASDLRAHRGPTPPPACGPCGGVYGSRRGCWTRGYTTCAGRRGATWRRWERRKGYWDMPMAK